MILKLKSKKLIRKIILINLLLTFLISIIVLVFNIPWNVLDYKVNDFLYKKVLRNGNGPKADNKIVYLNITDKSYNFFGSNDLDRNSLTQINNTLAQLNPQAVFYDIIFPRSSNSTADENFARSIANLGVVYLPAGFKLSEEPAKFRWEKGTFFSELKNDYLKKLTTEGNGEPYYGKWAVTQKGIFAGQELNSGHISVVRDADGIIRHFPLVIKVDSLFFPTISLAMFLDYNNIPFNKVKIDWGNYLIIPALRKSFISKDIKIPIDDKGNVFIPFQNFWDDGKTKMIEAQNLIKYSEDPKYSINLHNFFEGNFVLISDISVGTSDLGQTTIEKDVPLITVHSALLNSFLTNTFYTEWKPIYLVLLIFPLGLLIGFSSFLKRNIYLYSISVLILALILVFSYLQILDFYLFPVATAFISIFFISLGMIISLNVVITKDQAFIKNAFSRYVPEKVVDTLLENPDLLKLGGEEKELTILFSDIANFTNISENIKSTELVSVLNKYLTAMSDIVIENKGIIDKYIGDAILAEFGAPISLENHQDAAVTSALLMHKKISQLDKEWKNAGLPDIRCRIGINSGNVVIGNMGSDRVFDYTVIGDAVNTASRLEGANKRYNTHLMISENTFHGLTKDKYKIRILDVIKVKGKNKAVKVYHVYGFSDDAINQADIDYYNLYDEAFKLIY